MRLVRDHPLGALNTFGFERCAERYAEVADEASLVAALALAEAEGWPVFVLGGGSNLVLTRDVPGLTLRMTDGRIDISPAGIGVEGALRARAGAGVGWNALVEATLAAGADGLENLALIPGTVGAAPVQNIGAYGVELADRVERVRAWHRPSRGFVELAPAECGFAYRDSRFKRERGDWVIVRVDFLLGPQVPRSVGYASLAGALSAAPSGTSSGAPTAREVADAVIRVRRSKLPDPATIGNAGSFFHNPVVTAAEASRLRAEHPGIVAWDLADGGVKLAAGWLVERLGFRGARRGPVGVHADQALVLVHEGGGTGAQLLALVDEIRVAAMARYGVALTIEPVLV